MERVLVAWWRGVGRVAAGRGAAGLAADAPEGERVQVVALDAAPLREDAREHLHTTRGSG